MEHLEDKVVELLIDKKYTITTVESCSGGLLAGRIINCPGASGCFNEGYITYSNKAKEKLVAVNRETLEKYGAVSEEVAYEMAVGGAKAGNANVALSVTGIAGPGGGSESKPVGLVYIGCSINDKVKVIRCMFDGDRETIRNKTVNRALELLYECLS